MMVEADEVDGGDANSAQQQVPRMTVPTHGLTRYLRVGLEVTDGDLRWDVPRTLLGVVPIGTRHVSLPVADVRSLQVHRVVRWVNLVIGAACIVAPLVFGLWWFAGPMAIFGIWVILVSLGPRLDMVTESDVTGHASVCFSHQLDAELYMAAVTDLAEEVRNEH